MSSDVRGDVEIYEYFSDCLKLFMKKMMLLNKLMNSDCEQLSHKLHTNLNQILSEANALLEQFTQLQMRNSANQPVFGRFVLRVRESVHNFYLKASTPEILSYLRFIDNIIKEFTLNSSMESLLKIILLKTPTKLTHNQPGKQTSHPDAREEYHQQHHQQPKPAPAKDQSHFDLYDKYLEALNREYRLFDCLNIEQLHYRRTFFTALEDHNRKDVNLYEEMMYRNRYTKQTMRLYQRHFDNNRRKQQEKKQKLLKTEISLMELKQRKSNFDIITIYDQKNTTLKTPISPQKLQSAPKRLKTDYNPRSQSLIQQNPIPLGTYHNFQNKKNSQSFKQSLKTPTKTHFYSSSLHREELFVNTRVLEVERQSLSKNMNYIQLKKVQFRGARIQLVPEQIEKKSDCLLGQEQRRRRLNSRANEHFRKKISFINQPRAQKSIQFRSQQLGNPNKQTELNMRISNYKV